MDRREALTAAAVGLLAAGAPGAAEPAGQAPPRTFGAMGKQRTVLEPGREVELFRRAGAGCLSHMWFAMDECVRIRVAVDGEAEPSIDMPQDLGHGYAFGGPPEPWGIARFGRQGGVYNTYRIPFASGVRVTALPTADRLDGVTGRDAWWIIRGCEGLTVQVGGAALPARARLRLHRLEAHRARPLEEFPLCDIPGAGALYQVALAVQGDRPLGTWEDQSYQEGCVRAYIDGAREPLMLSSGLEDYFASSGYFHHRRLFQSPLSGLTHIDPERNRFSAYRIHDDDPVFFRRGLRLTLRCGETRDGQAFHHPPPAVYSACVWAYEW